MTTQYTKPLQRTSFAEKIKDDFKLCRDTMDYYISRSRFHGANPLTNRRNIIELYQVYNNEFPADWFNFVMNPLNSDNPNYSNFPARIRKLNILRTNIDRLIGEYNKRPFMFGVENRGENAYDSYLEKRKEALKQNVYQNFLNELAQQGMDVESQEVPPPEDMLKQFDGTYQDAIAIKAQKFLNVIKEDAELIEVFSDMFKDYCISGEVYSFKEIVNDRLVYERLSPAEVDHDKSPNKTYVRDSEWVVHTQFWTISDVVDRFYDELKEKDYKSLDNRYSTSDAFVFADSLRKTVSGDYVEVSRVYWVSQKKVGIFAYPDPVTGEVQLEEVDDTFKIPKHLKGIASLEWEWRNQKWLGYRINGDIYADIAPVPFNPFNGRAFSDWHSQNVSVLEMGVPYLILYVILNYRLEITIARSKGKIALIDQNVIPTSNGWDEDRFIYYSEAMGWGLINRDQIGVDKSFNQYSVLDLSLYQHINQLIEVIEYVKRQWDEVVGMNEYRKGQSAPSAGKGLSERAVFQGSIVSDVLFFSFENFIKKEYEDILEMSKYMNKEGIRRIFLNSAWDSEILDLLPEEMVHEDLGIFVTNSAVEQDRIRELKNYAQQSLANGGRLSTIADLVASDSMAEIRRILKTTERQEIAQAEASAENEAARAQQIEMIKKEFEQFKALLDVDKMEREYDRKEQIEHIKGQYNQLSFTGTMDANANQVPDALEVARNQQEIVKEQNNLFTRMSEIRTKQKIESDKLKDKEKDRNLKREEIQSKERIEQLKSKTALANKVSGE